MLKASNFRRREQNGVIAGQPGTIITAQVGAVPHRICLSRSTPRMIAITDQLHLMMQATPVREFDERGMDHVHEQVYFHDRKVFTCSLLNSPDAANGKSGARWALDRKHTPKLRRQHLIRFNAKSL